MNSFCAFYNRVEIPIFPIIFLPKTVKKYVVFLNLRHFVIYQ